MIAGPSEILIIADELANEKFIAADLMSQAEHDVLAVSNAYNNFKGTCRKGSERARNSDKRYEQKRYY